jgi:hypothetical protein
MSALTEIDAMKAIEGILSQLEDQGARDRVLRWAWDKYSQQPLPAPGGRAVETSRKRKTRSPGKKKAKRPSQSIVKDLNLRPEGAQSFRDFARGKKPTNHLKRCTVAVYYLTRVLDVTRVTANHVYTCYKDVRWRLPSDLYTTLLEAASRHGWLDTGDMEKITLTPLGETMVEYDLPGASTASGS